MSDSDEDKVTCNDEDCGQTGDEWDFKYCSGCYRTLCKDHFGHAQMHCEWCQSTNYGA